MNIPFFRYPHCFTEYKEEIDEALHSVLENGAYILQKELEDFERAAAEFVGAKHAIGVANGTDSLIMACKLMGLKPSDEVIMASHTYIATAAGIHFGGGKPVLVDCMDDRMIDPAAVEAAITPNTVGIMPTQLNGRTCDMDALQKIADKHGLFIIEDSAQALGAKFKGQCAGTFGAMGSISLYPAKLLGCFGDGGLLFTDDDDLAEKLFQFRDHGRNTEGVVSSWGINSRLDNMQAAVCSVKLRHYPAALERRREIARRYQKGLESIPEMLLPVGPDDDADRYDCFQNYEVEGEHRDELRAHLKENGVGTIIQWAGKAVHQFEALNLGSFDLPRTEKFFERCFLLPMNTSVTDEEIGYICDLIQNFYNERR